MLPDRSTEPRPDEPAPLETDVIALGDDATGHDATPRRRHRTLRKLDRIRADERTTPLAVAALGLAAVFGSLLNDWATIRVRETATAEFQPNQFRVAASNIGIDAGYLVGILAIVALTAVAIFGTSAVRQNARVAGMAVAAGVLVMLVAATSSLDATLNRMFPFFGPGVAIDARYESGIPLAYAGTAALGLALYLAGRSRRTRSPAPDDGEPGEPDDPGAARTPRPGWVESDEPVREVTVLPTPPFTPPNWQQQQ